MSDPNLSADLTPPTSANTTASTSVSSSNTAVDGLMSELVAMGFSDGAAAAAVAATEHRSVDAALSYLLSDGDDIEHKLVLVVDASLHMRTGKIAAQCAHAALGSYMTLVDKSANNPDLTTRIPG